MATYTGTGSRTFIQGFARVCCKIARYLTKHQVKMKAAQPGLSACIDSMLTCAVTACSYLNKSAP